jgi:hypothetical protein
METGVSMETLEKNKTENIHKKFFKAKNQPHNVLLETDRHAGKGAEQILDLYTEEGFHFRVAIPFLTNPYAFENAFVPVEIMQKPTPEISDWDDVPLAIQNRVLDKVREYWKRRYQEIMRDAAQHELENAA